MPTDMTTTATVAPLTSKRCANDAHRECTGQREVRMTPLSCECACHRRCADCNEPMPTRHEGPKCGFCLNLDRAFYGYRHTTDEEFELYCPS